MLTIRKSHKTDDDKTFGEKYPRKKQHKAIVLFICFNLFRIMSSIQENKGIYYLHATTSNFNLADVIGIQHLNLQ